MTLARVYNHITGSNVTHWDMMELGLNEETVLTLAIELMEK